jgi:hypothetical protein
MKRNNADKKEKEDPRVANKMQRTRTKRTINNNNEHPDPSFVPPPNNNYNQSFPTLGERQSAARQ